MTAIPLIHRPTVTMRWTSNRLNRMPLQLLSHAPFAQDSAERVSSICSAAIHTRARTEDDIDVTVPALTDSQIWG